MIKVLFLSLAVAMVSGQYYGHSQGGYKKEEGYHGPAYQSKGGYESHDEYTEPHYSFEYSVHDPHTGDIHSQKEERKGDSTHGEYSLVEADGSKRNVQYHVEGKSGFLAEVHREEGKGGYEKPSYYKPEPAYHKPEPSYYKPEPAYHKPEPSYYKPQPSYYKPEPSYHKPEPSYYKPSYSSHY